MEEQKEITKENETPKKKHIFKIILFLFLFMLVLFYLYIHMVEPTLFMVHEYAVVDNNLPASYDGTKIVHFSDILYGSTIHEKDLEKVVEKINELKADVVVFTGDLFNDMLHLDEKNYSVLKEKLGNIKASYRKYAVIGNCDYVSLSAYKEIMENAGFIILENANDLLYFKGNDPLMFIGTSSLLESEYDLTKALYTEEDHSNYYKIWLNHEPIIMDLLVENNIDANLILAGHTLHGLIHSPFWLLQQDGVRDYVHGYYEKENRRMYITNGIGTYKYTVRFLNYPSINLYRLYSHL